MQKTISLVMLVLVGCGGSPTPVIPDTTGDFVSNKDGIGTAQVFGINFSAHIESGGASTNDAIHADFINPDRSIASKRFTLGDETTIQLESIDASEVRFTFNEKNLGNLKVGDKVEIDDDQNVEVNGIPRVPALTE